ncbi:MAG TPA: CDP-alcohol phosphatidyltransferase family protein, partial [Pseudolysinimonas sp.]|nr:CDP-alcohol phosphatidyltransferase family protein [Pseudolysinimonas sp.]
ALLLIAVSAITDFVDGYVARHFNQISRLGQLLDPAADRLFILSTLLGLGWVGVLPWWFVTVVIARDVLLLVLGVVLANHRFGPLPVHHLGKMGTFAILFAMPVLLLAEAFPNLAGAALPVGWAAAIWGVFLYWWAGVAYILQATRMIGEVRVVPASASDTVDR